MSRPSGARSAKATGSLLKSRLLPGKTELFDLAADPGENDQCRRAESRDCARPGGRLLAYAKQQKPSEWIKAQPAFVGARERLSSIRTSTSTMADCRTRNPGFRRSNSRMCNRADTERKISCV